MIKYQGENVLENLRLRVSISICQENVIGAAISILSGKKRRSNKSEIELIKFLCWCLIFIYSSFNLNIFKKYQPKIWPLEAGIIQMKRLLLFCLEYNIIKFIPKGVKILKKSVVIMVLMSLLVSFLYGCASKGYVKEQTDSLTGRINKLETSNAQLTDRINKLETDCASSKADAAEALQTAKEGASKSDADAQRAETAAKKAEVAAKKAEKAFELHQRK